MSPQPWMTLTMDQLLVDPKETPASLEPKQKQAIYFPFSRTNPVPAPPPIGQTSATKCTVQVRQEDCVETALDLATNPKYRVGILNFANEYNCGGGFDYVNGSQEEYLFRRTDVGLSLWPHRRNDDNERWPNGSRKLGKSQSFYPLTEAGGILTPHVEIIGSQGPPVSRQMNPSWRYLSQSERPPHSFAVLTLAAQDLRPGRAYNRGVEFDYELTCHKFRCLAHMAVAAKCNALVLGAIGCGAFQNPPQHICRAFGQVILGEYRQCFDHVVFSIILSPGTYQIFQAYFQSNAFEGGWDYQDHEGGE